MKPLVELKMQNKVNGLWYFLYINNMCEKAWHINKLNEPLSEEKVALAYDCYNQCVNAKVDEIPTVLLTNKESINE